MKIKLDKSNPNRKIDFSVLPVVQIIRIVIATQDKNWATKFSSTSLKIKLTCFDAKKKEIASYEDYLSFGAIISGYHVQPVLELQNRFFSLPSDLINNSSGDFKSFQAEIILHNDSLSGSEYIDIDLMHSEHIKNRVDDWEKRIIQLINEIKSWSIENVEVKTTGKYAMHEGLMKQFGIRMREIPTVGVYKDSNLKVALKPFGLWITGANGRVDLLTSQRNYILIDEADQFQTPVWKLILNNNREKSVDFSKDTFLKILNQ